MSIHAVSAWLIAGGVAVPCAAATTGTPARTATVAARVLGITNAMRPGSMCLLIRVPGNRGRRLADFARAGADVVALFHRQNEHPSVTDFAGSSRGNDRFDHLVDDGVGDDDFNLHLRQQTDAVFLSAVDRSVTFLAAVTAHVGHRHPRDAQLLERLADIVDFVWAHDTLNQFHTRSLLTPGLRPGPRLGRLRGPLMPRAASSQARRARLG